MLVWWLGWYPGFLSSDSVDQLQQVASENFTNGHPAFHTISMWFVTRFWDSPAAISLLQIILLALVLAFIARRLIALGVPLWLAVGAVSRRWPPPPTERGLVPVHSFLARSIESSLTPPEIADARPDAGSPPVWSERISSEKATIVAIAHASIHSYSIFHFNRVGRRLRLNWAQFALLEKRFRPSGPRLAVNLF